MVTFIGEKEILDHGQQQFGDSERPVTRLGGLWAVVFSAALLMAVSGCASDQRSQQLYSLTESDGVVATGYADCFSTWRHAGTATTDGN